MIKTGSEGTSYCDQCEKWARDNERMRKALMEIAGMADGILALQIDWENIGRNAKFIAKSALSNDPQ